MLQPKRTKFRKQFKGRNRGLAHRGSTVAFGDYGLKATERGQLTARQIEAGRRAMTRFIKRGGKVWIRIFPDKPITQKPLEVRQGKGKGNVEYWAALVQPGQGSLRNGRRHRGDRARGIQARRRETPPLDGGRDARGDLMSVKEFRDKSSADLLEQLVTLRREQFNLRVQQATGQATRPDQVARVRRDIARLKTVLREREQQDETAGTGA